MSKLCKSVVQIEISSEIPAVNKAPSTFSVLDYAGSTRTASLLTFFSETREIIARGLTFEHAQFKIIHQILIALVLSHS